MKKIIFFLLATGIVSFVGCGGKTELIEGQRLPEISNNDFSTVYLSRESKVYGSAKAYPIQVNGQYLLRIGSGDCVTFKIPTGQSEIVFVLTSKRVTFVSERGKKYYLYVMPDERKAGFDMRQLTEEEWTGKTNACNWVELKEKRPQAKKK